MLEIGDQAPEFALLDDQGRKFTLSGQIGSRLLLVFYPGDNTPVCTRQLCDYRDGVGDFGELGVVVVGISGDTVESHKKFKNKHKLPFSLLADTDLKVAARYGSKGWLGMKRAVFLLDESAIIRYLHIEPLAVFRRTRKELLQVIAGLKQA